MYIHTQIYILYIILKKYFIFSQLYDYANSEADFTSVIEALTELNSLTTL